MADITRTAEELVWTPQLLEYLRKITRELKFDWKAIAQQVTRYCTGAYPGVKIDITPAVCREKFASDYNQSSTTAPEPKSLGPSGLSVPHNIKSVTEETLVQQKTVIKSPLTNFDDMSLDELVEYVDRKEKQMQVRKEEIFQRVHASLGGLAHSDTTEDAESISAKVARAMKHDPAAMAYQESLHAKELARLRCEQQREEQEEQRRLQQERETLRTRFDQGSADGDGEDPMVSLLDSLKSAGISVRQQQVFSESASGKESGGNPHPAHPQNLGIESGGHNDNDDDVIPTDFAMGGVTLDDLLGGEEFDAFLSQLEKEIDERAPDKEGTGKMETYWQ